MNMIDIQDLKSQITDDNIKDIMDDLNISFVKENTKELIYMTGCHNVNSDNGSPKLYYYKESQSFHCYTCGFSGDIIALIAERWKLLNKTFIFMDIIHYLIKIVKYQGSQNETKEFNWQKYFNKFSQNEIKNDNLTIYDKNILDNLDVLYPDNLLKDNISKSAIDKFQIKYYIPKGQICFPVFNINGDLVGIQARNTNQDLIDKGYKYIPLKTLSTEYKFPTSQCLFGLYQNQDNIRQTKEVILFEAAKSVLQLEEYVKMNNSVGLFGVNASIDKIYQLLQLGVNKINIALDKQYHQIKDENFEKWLKWVKKIYEKCRPYCDVYVIYDKENLLDFKDSPTDKGVDIWNELYYNRVKLK